MAIMLEFQKKKRLRRFIYSPISLFLVAFAIMVVGRGTWSVFHKAKESKEKLHASVIELERLQKRAETLSTQLTSLNTDRGIEEELRDKYRVAKEGEQMIILLGDGKEEEKPVEEKKHWWQIFR